MVLPGVAFIISWYGSLQKLLEWKQAVFFEVSYDVLQVCVIGWLLEQAKLKEEDFPFKLFMNFFNMAATVIDLFIEGTFVFEAFTDPTELEAIGMFHGIPKDAGEESIPKEGSRSEQPVAPPCDVRFPPRFHAAVR